MKLIHIIEVINGSPNIWSFRAKTERKAAKELFKTLAKENDVEVPDTKDFMAWSASDFEGYDLVVTFSYLQKPTKVV